MFEMQQCINVLKERIEKHRVERARDYLVSGVSDGSLFEHDQEEDDLLCSIDAEKVKLCLFLHRCVSMFLTFTFPAWLISMIPLSIQVPKY